jgi:ComF family protein
MKVKALEQIVVGLKDVVAPARCMGCLKEGAWFCQDCRRAFVYPPLTCVVCKKERPRGLTCVDCKQKTDLSGFVVAGNYSWPGLKRGIHWLKFKGVLDLAEPLAGLLIPRLVVINSWQELKKRAMIVPIPLHKRKMRARGFNQSRKIADVVGKYMGAPVIEALERTRSTWTQARLPADLRKENLVDSLALREKLPADRNLFLLVDDVVTTGSTLAEAARVLADGSDRKIWGVAVVRGG